MTQTNSRKVARTNVTVSQLAAAQGGHDPTESTDLVWVECPQSYRAGAITADDIIHDDQICTVDAPEVGRAS